MSHLSWAYGVCAIHQLSYSNKDLDAPAASYLPTDVYHTIPYHTIPYQLI